MISNISLEHKKVLSKKENRIFGLVLFILLNVVYFLMDNLNLYDHIIFIITGIAIILISFLIPSILTKPNAIWIKFGLLLGNFTSFFILLIIFLVLFFPIGTILRALNALGIKDKYETKIDSYWVKRRDPIQSMKKQF